MFSFMVWGYIWIGGRSELIFMNPTGTQSVKSREYISTLEQGLLPFYTSDMLFQQDNAPIHKSALTMKWFEDHEINPIKWPPYSPDLNPIENVWALLKRKIAKKYPLLRTSKVNEENKQLLMVAIKDCWDNLKQDTIDTIIKSLPRRLSNVIEYGGGNTKY